MFASPHAVADAKFLLSTMYMPRTTNQTRTLARFQLCEKVPACMQKGVDRQQLSRNCRSATGADSVPNATLQEVCRQTRP